MADEYNIVVDTLQKKLDEIEEMQKGCDKQRRVIGGGIGLMDCIRYEQMDELRQAIKREQALADVNETPKNEHDSGDVLKRSPLVRLTKVEVAGLIDEGAFLGNCYEIANAIMDAMDKKNGG